MYNLKTYKDGQVTAKILKEGDLHIKLRGNTYEDLFKIASVKEAWDSVNKTNKNAVARLTIYCLIGQRSDRRFGNGESFDLKVICDFINTMNFDKVYVLHPHSTTTLALINNSEKISHIMYVEKAYQHIGSPILVSPDAGAYKTTHEIANHLNADIVPSNKVRINGEPKISIQGNVFKRDCLIVDDLADGGRTFMYLAKELKNSGANKVYLYITHAQFNYGFAELKNYIDHIYCTNSCKDIESEYVTQFNLDF